MKPIFSQNARLSISAAVKEAGALGHTCIGSEHILLGILKQSECEAAKLLKKFGIEYENVRADVKERLGSGGRPGEQSNEGGASLEAAGATE